MPKFITERETIDLHAPWWSDTQDASGRYLERCVVLKEMTEKDEQSISSAVAPKMRTRAGSPKETEISLREQSFARIQLLLHMVKEITDEQGNPRPINKVTLETLSKRDSAWIADQLDELNKPYVQPTDEDEDEAEESGEDAGEIAQRRFRRAGARDLPR